MPLNWISAMGASRWAIILGLTAVLVGLIAEAPMSFAESDDESGIECPSGSPCVEIATGLPLLALPRPFSNVYRAPEATVDNITIENVRALYPVVIFERQNIDLSDPTDPKGWYQIGSSEVSTLGWMQAKDLVEWRQALVSAYVHPGSGDSKRRPVLGFESKALLEDMFEGDDRVARAREVYATLEGGAKPGGIVVSEPKDAFLDIDETFYLFPVIGWEKVELFDAPARYLQLIAQVPGARGPLTLADEEQRRQAMEAEFMPESRNSFGVDVVFLVDLTGSMSPHIGYTLESVQNMAIRMAEGPGLTDRIKFGFVGYRDDPETDSRNEFATKNYTPELIDSTELARIIDTQVKAYWGDPGIPEEIFAGLRDAVLQTKWREKPNLRVVIQIGDASANPLGTSQNTSGLDEHMVRRIADENDVYVMTVHLKNPRYSSDWPIAERQLRVLSRNPQAERSAYVAIPSNDSLAYKTAVDEILETFAYVLSTAKSGSAADVRKGLEERKASAGRGATGDARRAASELAEHALVDFLGDEKKPPRDVTFWAVDRDIVEPTKRSLNVRLLINRRQLDTLVRSLEQVVKALQDRDLTEAGFMKTLQAIVSQGIKNPEKVNFDTAKDLAETSGFFRWISSMPYRSKILSLTDSQIAGMTPEERANLELEVEGLIRLYQEILSNTGAWVALNENDPSLRHVYPLPLAQLP